MSEITHINPDNIPSLLLVRHGQTDWNLDGRYQGRVDTELSPLGRAQAQALAAFLSNWGARTLVSSPMTRARDTAIPIAQHLSLDLSLDERLCEIAYGDWEGMTQAQVKTRWPEALRRWKHRPDLYPPTGGEPLAAAAYRVRTCLDELTSRPSPVIAVTHTGIIRLARLLSEQTELKQFRKIPVDNAALFALDWPASSIFQGRARF